MTYCDLNTGMCAEPSTASSVAEESLYHAQARPGEILYVTDPICSHCWAMEPAWRKLLFHYGEQLAVRHLYGGLLPGWQGFQDAGAGIRQPADVAPHWAEVAAHFGQPIDPTVWLRDPLHSSYPPSIAAHAVRILAPELEAAFLRHIREALFLHAQNIARPDVLAESARALGLDPDQFLMLFHSGIAEAAFRRDLEEVRRLGVRGFPTLIIGGRGGQKVVLHGTRPYAQLEQAVLQVTGLPAAQGTPTPEEALVAYGSGTTKEFAELLNLDHHATVDALRSSGSGHMPLIIADWALTNGLRQASR